jgi:tetraacyldisaccharide 4'-kinase
VKTPAFWYRPPGPLSLLLSPAGRLYGAAGRLRFLTTTPARAAIPVLCVGNLVAGGAGKTPVALSLASLLEEHAVHFVTRGYGGSVQGPERDEALLLAEARPTWVARDRVAGTAAAAKAGAGLVILDDGFQNPRLRKDLSIVVVDGETGFGNGRLVPAGPLREPVSRGLSRADAVVLVGQDRTGALERLPGKMPVLRARIAPEENGELAGMRVFAFAGIGRPEKFFATLDRLGAEVVDRTAFADHHSYQPIEVSRLAGLAESRNAVLVTTAKDWVRLPPDLRPLVRVLRVSVSWEDTLAVRRLISPILPGTSDGL